HGHHAHGPAAQLGAHLLLHAGKVGVQVDEEPVEGGAGTFFWFWRSRAGGREIGKLLRPLLGKGRERRAVRDGHLVTIFVFCSPKGNRDWLKMAEELPKS